MVYRLKTLEEVKLYVWLPFNCVLCGLTNEIYPKKEGD